MLANLGIVLLQPKLLGGELFVLGSGVEVPGASAADELDFVPHGLFVLCRSLWVPTKPRSKEGGWHIHW